MSFSSGRTAGKQTVFGELEIDGALNHDGPEVGLYGATPVVRAAAIASPPAPSALYSQAEAVATKTAIDAIRNALKNVGITL